MDQIAAVKNRGEKGVMYKHTAFPRTHSYGERIFKTPSGRINNKTPRSANARLKRYWLIADSTCGLLMIVAHTMTFPATPKRQMMTKTKIVKPIGSVMYPSEPFAMALAFVFNEVLFDISPWCSLDLGKEC